jgi:tetratricopeptide (TPR) repeat protein
MTKATASDLDIIRLLRTGRAMEALPAARRLAASCATCAPAHGLLATVLMNLGERDEARAVIETAISLPVGGGDADDALAFVLLQLGDHDRSNKLYRRAVEQSPDEPRFWYNLASSERSFGRLAESEAACNRSIALDRASFQSYVLRSELRTQTDEANHVAAMEQLIRDSGDDDRSLMFVGYALGKELDDLGRYDEAFSWFTRAAAARRRHLAYDVSTDEHKLVRIAEVYGNRTPPDPELVAQTRRFVFIVGLPRTGTTLVERMLTRLPGVISNGETENFSRALLAEAPPEGPDIYARCAAGDDHRIAERYRILAGSSDGARVIEKLPLNYLYLGAIRGALPGATPIVLDRDPLDSCFAMFRTLFGAAYPFSYDFDELARYYASYRRLMDHWHRLFGDWLVDLRYEDLVADPARSGSALAAAAGVPWRNDAVAIERNTAISTTASASQIRQPIYRSSVGRWRHYRRHLEPLAEALRASGVGHIDLDL